VSPSLQAGWAVELFLAKAGVLPCLGWLLVQLAPGARPACGVSNPSMKGPSCRCGSCPEWA
jgi:hypothetical protein